MTKYILSRTLRSIFTVMVVFVCVFMLLRLMPLSGYFPEEMLKEGVKIRKGKKVFHKAILA